MRIHMTKAQAVAARDVLMAYANWSRLGDLPSLGSDPLVMERAAARIHAAIMSLTSSHLPVGPLDERDQT